ncbi:MAG: hypothetical protein KDD47_18645, partial [Acidobacteria bacterium]|nr:hypothetical protein [Acidobacteriota bacterium]
MSRRLSIRRCLAALVLTAMAVLAGGLPPVAAEEIYLVGATLHPVSGPVIPGGILHVSDSRIAAVGADLEVPQGARVIDLAGKHLYPAFVHAASVLGLTEVSAVAATVDSSESGDLNPELAVEVAFHGDSRLLEATRAAGVLYAHVLPRGGVLSGTSAVMRLEGWNWQDMVVEAPVGLHLRYPAVLASGRSFGPRPPKTQSEVDEERKERVEAVETLFEDARAYAAARLASSRPLAYDAKLEALLPALDGRLPLFLHAEEKKQIEAGLDFVEKLEIPRVVLVSSA